MYIPRLHYILEIKNPAAFYQCLVLLTPLPLHYQCRLYTAYHSAPVLIKNTDKRYIYRVVIELIMIPNLLNSL